MGIPSELRDMWASNRKGFVIASPAEEQKILRTKQCTNVGEYQFDLDGIGDNELLPLRLMQKGVRAGFKAASIACVASAVPTLAAVRVVPWAKANLNYTAQALIISAASIAAYFITADKYILDCARRNAQLENSLRHQK